MSEQIAPVADWCATAIEGLGVLVIVLLALFALIAAGMGLIQGRERQQVFREARQHLGGGILLGLEFLVAADIIHTVAVELNFQTVGVLAIVVLIRTFLSFTLEVELHGRWPWQRDGSRGV